MQHDWRDVSFQFTGAVKKAVFRCEICGLVKDRALSSTYEATYWIMNDRGIYKFISDAEISCHDMKMKKLLG